MLRETALDDNSWSRFQFSGGEFLPLVEPWEPGDFRANVSIVMMAVSSWMHSIHPGSRHYLV